MHLRERARKHTCEYSTVREKLWAIVLHQTLHVCVMYSQLKWPRDCTKAQPLHQGRLLWPMQTEQTQEIARHVSHCHFNSGATRMQHTYLVHEMETCLRKHLELGIYSCVHISMPFCACMAPGHHPPDQRGKTGATRASQRRQIHRKGE